MLGRSGCAFALLLPLTAVVNGAFTELRKDDKWTLVESDTEADFWDAKSHCQFQYGAPLAVPHTTAENEKLQLWSSGKVVWIGAQDFVYEDQWQSLDGVPLLEEDFDGLNLPWAPGQPDNAGGQDCALAQADGAWADAKCTDVQALFLCGAQVAWTPVFKVMKGSPATSGFDFVYAWKNGPSTPDEAAYLASFDAARFEGEAVDFFRSSAIDDWNAKVSAGEVDRVKVALYAGGEEVVYFVYTASSDPDSWMAADHYVDSSYCDVSSYTNSEKMWGMAAGPYSRQFTVWAHDSSCANDEAWMLVSTADPGCAEWGAGAGEGADSGATIWYSTAEKNSGGLKRGKLAADAARADTLVVYTALSGSTYQSCPIEQHLLDWDAMFAGEDPLKGTSTVSVAKNTLLAEGGMRFDVRVTAPYLMGGVYEAKKALYESVTASGYLGVTYVLETGNLFESAGQELKTVTNCENRVDGVYEGKDFLKDYWHVSSTPSDPSALGSTQFLAYPPAGIWSVDMVDAINEPCGDIQYYHTFTWDELRNCHGFSFADTGTALELTGTLYLAAVSPLPWILKSDACHSTDCGQYLTYTLQTHDIVVKFVKQRVVVSNSKGVKVDLFTSHVVSATYDDYDHTFKMVLITSVPNFMSLNAGTADIISPRKSDLLDINGNEDFLDGPLHIVEEKTSYPTDDCLVLDQYRCFQKWIISAVVDNFEKPRAFDGDYFFAADMRCEVGKGEVCADYVSEESETVTLDSVHFKYTETFEGSIYRVDWNGEIQFFADEHFTGGALTEATYHKGDTVYTRVIVDSIGDYSVVGMHIEAAYLCGSDNKELGEEGCLAGAAGGIDTLLYNILADEGLKYTPINGELKDNFKDFSFLLPLIADSTFFVHAEVVLDIVEARRRRLSHQRVVLALGGNRKANVFKTVVGEGHILHGELGSNSEWWSAYVMVGALMAITVVGLALLINKRKAAAMDCCPQPYIPI